MVFAVLSFVVDAGCVGDVGLRWQKTMKTKIAILMAEKIKIFDFEFLPKLYSTK